MSLELTNYLQDNATQVNNNEPYTFKTYLSPSGNWKIEDSHNDFWKMYCELAIDPEEMPILSIGEPIDQLMPLIIQLKLNFAYGENEDPDDIATPYDDKFLLTLIKSCQDTIVNTYEISDEEDELICAIQKTNDMKVEYATSTISSTIKLQFPYCRVDKHTIIKQYIPALIRLLKLENISGLMRQTPEGDITKWIDSDIYNGTNPLYLSIRNNLEQPVILYRICDYVDDQCIEESKYPELMFENIFKPNTSNMVKNGLVQRELFETFEDYDALPIFLSLNYWSKIVFPKKTKRSVPYLARSLQLNRREEGTDTIEAINNNMDLARIFVNYLAPIRANKRHYWMDVGRALYNCDQGEDRGLDMWKNFTQRHSTKFDADECEDIYDTLDIENSITVKTLAWYAKEDSSELYAKWHKGWLLEAMDRSMSLSNTDVATALYRCYWLTFTCSSRKEKMWYKFNGTIWMELDAGDKLRLALSNGFKNKYERYRASISQQVALSNDPTFKATAEAKIIKIGQIIKQLTNVTPKNMIVTEAMEHFKDDNFNIVANRNPDYMGLKNRIIETTSEYAVVRKGKPEDYITIFSSIKWRDNMTEDSRPVKRFLKWMNQCFPDPELRDYVMRMFASCLQSRNSEKIFPVLSGIGDNSKSMVKQLIEAVFGPYSFTFPTEMVTEKVKGRGNASPELALAEFAKVAWLVEPDESDTIKNGQLKKLTGDDLMFARKLHSNGSNFIPMYTLILMCNKIPMIPGADKATMNRFRSIPFISTWVKDAPESVEEQIATNTFQLDTKFSKTIPSMAPGALWFFVEIYSDYCRMGLSQPEAVTKATNEYWEDNDIYRLFTKECIVEAVDASGTRDMNAGMNLSTTYEAFTDWFERNYQHQRIPERSSLKYELEMKYRWGPMSKQSWWGIKQKRAMANIGPNTGISV